MIGLREPYEESTDLYPGLVVHDGRVTGSITVRRSRLPLWAIVHTALTHGWDEVERGWSPTEHYEYGPDDLAEFLSWLLEMRGDFGRLLLALANAERTERCRQSDADEAHFAAKHPVSRICDCGYVDMPSWQEDPNLKAPVVDLLKRCLAALEGDAVDTGRKDGA